MHFFFFLLSSLYSKKTHSNKGKEVIEALRSNTWFEVLKVPMNATNFKPNPDLIVAVSDMLRQNSTIKVLEMTHVPSGAPFATIGKDLAQNKSLLTLSFANSEMEDRGLIALSTDFFTHCQNLTQIDISSCSAEKKGKIGPPPPFFFFVFSATYLFFFFKNKEWLLFSKHFKPTNY